MSDTADTGVNHKNTSKSHRKHWAFLTPPDPATLTPAQNSYNNFSAFPMFIASLLWMLSSFFVWVPSLHDVYHRAGVILSLTTWLIFLLDMIVRFVLDPSKKDFISRNWPLLIALIFPPLRVLLVASAVMRIKRDRNALAKIVGLYAIYAVAFVVFFGAVITLCFEIDANGSSIRSYGDAVWWGFETVTTVGYGDYTPVTVAGRMVAVMIMFTGAASVGAVTAAVASRFINSPSTQAPADPSTSTPPNPTTSNGTQIANDVTTLDGATSAELSRQLAALQAQVELIATKLGVTSE